MDELPHIEVQPRGPYVPPTARALVELMLDGSSASLDLAPFDPARVVGG